MNATEQFTNNKMNDRTFNSGFCFFAPINSNRNVQLQFRDDMCGVPHFLVDNLGIDSGGFDLLMP